jgi:hypothetical protein
MKTNIFVSLLVVIFCLGCSERLTLCPTKCVANDKWISLFNGEDLSGWKASEKPDCFSVENGTIKVSDGRSHLFYVGDVEGADFTDFEFMASVKTTPGSNSGIYIHTKYQETGWPKNGYETQVNISHKDPKKSGGLYAASDVSNPPAKDNQWYTHHVVVKGKHVTVAINGKQVVDYTEAADVSFKGWPGRKLSSGTFAIQGHDPKSVVYFKDIKVKPIK